MIGAFRSVYRSKVSTCIVEVSKPAFQYDPLVVVSVVGNTCSRVPVDSVVCLQMVFSNVVYVTVLRRSSVFSQSRVQISVGLTDISGLAVAAFDLINCSLSVPRLVFVFDVSQLLS